MFWAEDALSAFGSGTITEGSSIFEGKLPGFSSENEGLAELFIPESRTSDLQSACSALRWPHSHTAAKAEAEFRFKPDENSDWIHLACLFSRTSVGEMAAQIESRDLPNKQE